MTQIYLFNFTLILLRKSCFNFSPLSTLAAESSTLRRLVNFFNQQLLGQQLVFSSLYVEFTLLPHLGCKLLYLLFSTQTRFFLQLSFELLNLQFERLAMLLTIYSFYLVSFKPLLHRAIDLSIVFGLLILVFTWWFSLDYWLGSLYLRLFLSCHSRVL